MSEAPQGQGAARLREGPGVRLHRIYVKDLSFEAPHVAAGLHENWQPARQTWASHPGRAVGNDHLEVVLV